MLNKIEIVGIDSLCEVVRNSKIKFKNMAQIVKLSTGIQIKFSDSRGVIAQKLHLRHKMNHFEIKQLKL